MDGSFPYIDTEITKDEVINQFEKLRDINLTVEPGL